MLREHDGGPPLLVDAAQDAQQLVAGDRVELGGRLVEQQQPRAARERCAEGDALELAARQLVGRALEQPGDTEGQRRLLHAARDRRGAPAAVLEREGQLRAHRAHDDLRLRVLEQRARDRRQLRRAVRARVEAARDEPSGELPAVEVRDEPGRRAQQRRLARAGAAREHDELAGLDPQRDVGERRRGRAGIGVRHAIENELAHRPIPFAVSERQPRAPPTAGRGQRRLSPVDGRRQRGVGLEGLPARHRRGDPERREHERGRGERDVVTRPRSPASRRAGGAAVAANLERGGDVDGAVERARRHRARERELRRRPARPAALCVAEAPRVAREHRNHAGRQRRSERGPERQPAEGAQQLVRVDRRGVQREARDHDQRAQPEDAAVGDRLERHVDLPQRRQLAEPRDHRQPVAHHEGVDRRDQQRERQPPQQRACHHIADPRPRRGAEHRDQQRPEQQRMLERQGHAGEHDAEQRADTGARRVQRAVAAPVAHGVVPLDDRGGRRRQRQRHFAPLLERDGEVVLQPVLDQCRGRRGHADLVGAGDHPAGLLVQEARRRHQPGARAERADRLAARVEQLELRARLVRPREHARDLRTLLEPPRGRVDAHVRPAPDEQSQHTRPRARAERPQAADLRAHGLQPLAHLAALAQRVVGAVDPDRQLLALRAVDERLGERADHGRDPHRRAPVVVVPPHAVARLEPPRCGSLLGFDPVDVIEPVDRPPAAPAARHTVDLLHEPAAVARVDRERPLQLAHHGLAAGDPSCSTRAPPSRRRSCATR